MMTELQLPDLLSTAGSVLAALIGDQDIRMRAIALRVGVTERCVQELIAKLVAAGCVTIHKHGRRNRYEILIPAAVAASLLQIQELRRG